MVKPAIRIQRLCAFGKVFRFNIGKGCGVCPNTQDMSPQKKYEIGLTQPRKEVGVSNGNEAIECESTTSLT